MLDSDRTFSEFSDMDHPFDADGNKSVERSDCRFTLFIFQFSLIFPVNVGSCDSGIRCQSVPLKLRKDWFY